MSLAESVYEATKSFPGDERFGMTAQMRRAAVSVPANFAEGYGRETTGSYIHFARIAQGSARELETLIEPSARVGLLSVDSRDRLATLVTSTLKMLRGLIRALERKS